MSLTLQHARSGETLEFVPRSLIIAGFTGRDRDAVARHVEELERMGVPCPAETPTFYRLEPSLLTTDREITVTGSSTSGEVEPVLFRVDGAQYLGVGSDHTDRLLEQRDIAESKAACPKVVGPEVLDYAEAVQSWDGLRLRASTGDGEPYQDGAASELLTPPELLELLAARGGSLEDGDVVFLGTLPLKTESFVFSDRWMLELEPPEGPMLRCSYEVGR